MKNAIKQAIFKSNQSAVLFFALSAYFVLSWIEGLYRTYKGAGILEPIVPIQIVLIAILIVIAISAAWIVVDERRNNIKTGNPVSVGQILTAYFFSTGSFSMIYFQTYRLCSDCFSYTQQGAYSSNGVEQVYVYMDFLIFSAYKSLTQAHYSISESSNLIGILVLAQTAFSIYIVSVLIASSLSNIHKVQEKSITNKVRL